PFAESAHLDGQGVHLIDQPGVLVQEWLHERSDGGEEIGIYLRHGLGSGRREGAWVVAARVVSP
ncbi:MAG TPA: hypothetical protein VHB98_02940, partial [Chloroflexota bacterium]|nr:hypothetical protein [Chloroflexota bacterium]